MDCLWGCHLPFSSRTIRDVLNKARARSLRPPRLQLLRIFAALLLLTLSSAATAETFSTPAAAARLALPRADSFREESRTLTPAQRDDLESRTRLRFPENSYRCFIATRQQQAEGYALVMNEVGKHEYITFVVGISPQGKVTGVIVTDFRESRGGEVREKRFLRQFQGKRAADPLQVDSDITNYTGATLSSHALARGVRKALLLAGLFYLHNAVAQPERHEQKVKAKPR